jgi:hypothetical protein
MNNPPDRPREPKVNLKGATPKDDAQISGEGLPKSGERTIEERYGDLTKALRILCERIEKEKIAPLNAGYMSLAIIVHFLQEDVGMRQLRSTKSLFSLHRNIYDLLKGTRAPMFYRQNDSGVIRKNSKDNVPIDTSIALFRAQVVLAVELLINAGMRTKEAALLVARELKHRGIHPTRSASQSKEGGVEATQVSRWYYEKSGHKHKQITGFAEAYGVLVRDKPKESWPVGIEKAKEHASHLLVQLKERF